MNIMPAIPYDSAFKIEAQFVMPDGRRRVLKFPITNDLQITTEYSYCGSKSIDVSFSTGDFIVEMIDDTPVPMVKNENKAESLKPLEKEEKEVSTGNFIAAIFPDKNGSYQPDAKIYYYEVLGNIPSVGNTILVLENQRITQNVFNLDSVSASHRKEKPYGDNQLHVIDVFKNVQYSCMPVGLEAIAKLSVWTRITKYEETSLTKEKLKEKKSLTIDMSNLDMSKITVPIDSVQSIGTEDSLRISFKNGQEFKVYNMEDKNMNMKKLIGDFTFGKFNDSSVKYSFNGVAFRAADGTYNVYNEDGTITNVSDMVIDIPIFAMPVAKADIKVGDIILHPAYKTPLVVKENAQTAIIAVEPKSNEVKTFAPKKSIFGFDFYTKITTPMDMFGGAHADESNPFGNMLPFLMLGDGEFDMSTMLMFSMMNGKGGAMDMNAMLPFLMLNNKSDGGNNDFLMAMLMAKNFNFAQGGEK